MVKADRGGVARVGQEQRIAASSEPGDDGAIAPCELAMIRRSADNMRAIGLAANLGD